MTPAMRSAMRYIRWALAALALLLFAAFLHYTLPQRDVVRITDTYEKRIDFGENSLFWAGPDAGSALSGSRDVFFIQAIRPDGDPIVYRNEDTGWGWPPYFKFDTSNLQTEAADLKSTRAAPQWAVITHYGWRNEFFSIYPNAVGVRPVEGPDVGLFPWLNVIILAVMALLGFWLLRIARRLVTHGIAPRLRSLRARVRRR